MNTALIIEDEAYSADHLERLLEATEIDFKILDKITTVKKSVAWLRANDSPDLIFMDIQLADGICFEIFNQVKVKTPIIFTTAYDQYAIKAFKVNSIDYLLKPINKDELSISLKKFKEINSSKSSSSLELSAAGIQKLLKNLEPKYKNRFVIRIGDHLKTIETQKISHFTSKDKITYLVTAEGRKYAIDYSLHDLENILDPSQFFRVNRQIIIAMNSIVDIIAYSNSRLKIEVLHHSESIVVSRERVLDFKKWLDH